MLRSLSRIRSLVTKRPAAEKLLSDSTDVGGMLFKASSRRSMFVVRWPVASKRSNFFARCLSLFFFMGVTLSVSINLMAASDCLSPLTPWKASWSNVSVSDAFHKRLHVRNGLSCVCKTVENTSLKLSLHVRDAFCFYLNDSIQCFLIKYNA